MLRNQSDYQRAELTAINDGLAVPIYDLLDRGGKKWRPVLGMVFAECFGRDVAASIERGNTDKHRDVLYVCGLTEIVHNGSLMADDLEDKSLMRRGQPCTYLKYGDDYAVNGSSFMYFAPMAGIDKFISDPTLQLGLTRVFLREMLNLHYGQNWDLHWHNGNQMPTEDQYLQMVINKTSVLPRLCVNMISQVVGVEPTVARTMSNYTETLGASF